MEVGLVGGGGLQPDGLVLVTDACVGDEGAGEHRTEQLEHLRGVDRRASRGCAQGALGGADGVLRDCPADVVRGCLGDAMCLGGVE